MHSKAVEPGFYPVMTRGFSEPQAGVWLEAGDVWKYGTTKNPETRYSQTFLDAWGLRYFTEFKGSSADALLNEKGSILTYLLENGTFLQETRSFTREGAQMHVRITGDFGPESGLEEIVDGWSGPTRRQFLTSEYGDGLNGVVLVLLVPKTLGVECSSAPVADLESPENDALPRRHC